MKLARLVSSFGMAAALLAVPAAAAPALDAPVVELAQGDEPVVTVAEGTEEGGSGDEWTFRYLVPTAFVISAVIVVLVVVGYALRVRGRYRVSS